MSHRGAGESASTASQAGTRKRKWSDELDALLLREAKLQKPLEKKYGDRGATYASMASNLNACGRMPWRTDQKHIQGRLQHLMDARRAHQRVSARATGIEEEHGELECLLDDLIDESDRFKASEAERRDTLRERDMALAESGRQARELAMSRQAPAGDAESIDGSDEGGSDVNFEADVNLDVERQERSTATPSSTRSPEFLSGDVEAQVLRLLRENASSVAKQMERSATTEERRLQAETEREGEKKEFEKKKFEVSLRRIKVEEERETRLERQEERQSRMEELRIAGQKAQTDMMLKMLEMLQSKKF
jgi:hypothetical protein